MLFLIISYDFSSTKLENKRAEQVLPGSKEGGGRVWGRGKGREEGKGGPNNVYTCE
jgi:hypothetical protein